MGLSLDKKHEFKAEEYIKGKGSHWKMVKQSTKEFASKLAFVTVHQKMHQSCVPKNGVIKLHDYLKPLKTQEFKDDKFEEEKHEVPSVLSPKLKKVETMPIIKVPKKPPVVEQQVEEPKINQEPPKAQSMNNAELNSYVFVSEEEFKNKFMESYYHTQFSKLERYPSVKEAVEDL